MDDANRSRRYKFGALGPDGTDVEFRYDNRFEHTSGPDRLVIAPAKDHVALLGELAGLVPGPYYLLYVLVVGRTGRAEGRYQSSELTLDELRHFLSEHAVFLEHDGRHALWISEPSGRLLLVYDRHQVIYAYGPVHDIRRLLVSRGFHEESVSFPSPHSHKYSAEGDGEEDRLFGSMQWRFFPLQDGDDR